MNWKPISTAPKGGRHAKILVTNNLNARDAWGHMTHIWLVPMIHKAPGKRNYIAYLEGTMQQIHSLTHWAEIPGPDEELATLNPSRKSKPSMP